MKEQVNIICFGDSITEAEGFPENDKWPNLLQAKLDDLFKGKYKVYNRGIGGNTTSQGFERIPTDVIPYLPAVVLIQFGFNDANVRDWAEVPRVGLEEYKKNLYEFHRIIGSQQGRSVFIVNHSIIPNAKKQLNGKTYYDNFMPYNEAVKEIARDVGTPIIDLPVIMKNRKVDLKEFVIEDGLHLSANGNHIYADMVFERLKEII
ncbi:SGNH/GDSL hydrolase family protein [Verrucomicrobiota bacterium]